MIGYFILRSGEDGTSIDGPFTEVEALKRVQPNSDGECYYGVAPQFLHEVPKSDGGCWMNVPENALLIIKGEIIVPKEEKVVTRLKL